ncbi:MAG: type II toxin-antitoxin system RelE/ParE family toxin [Candidatus Pacearchaeota archaeon]
MVEVEFTKEFRSILSSIKDSLMRTRILKQIKKIKVNLEVGKPMRNVRKGTRELYIKPFRLSYEYLKSENVVYILDLYHKKKQ